MRLAGILMILTISVSTCDSGCVRLFAPKAEVSDGEITQALNAEASSGESFDHSRFGALLETHVDYDNAAVDYASLQEDKSQLDAYLDSLARAELDSLNADGQLALLINAYNAFTLALILEHYPDIDSIKDLDKPWDTVRWTLAGHEVSLNEIEHGLMRPIFKDSRIHFAVNCASIGCPPLAPWPYTGDKLDEQLDRAAKRTFRDDNYARVRDGTLQVSSLLNWYRPDFISGEFEPSAESVPLYVARFGDDEIRAFVEENEDPAYSFIEYDWSLNDSP